MTIDQSRERPITWFKPSHRSLAEQAVGASIFLTLSWASRLSFGFLYIDPELFASQNVLLFKPAWMIYHFLAACSIWMLWRRYSLKVLKLELVLFLFQLALLAGWATSFYFQGPLVALASIIFLNCGAVLSALLYWKKEQMAGQFTILQLMWIFYVMVINMLVCVS